MFSNRFLFPPFFAIQFSFQKKFPNHLDKRIKKSRFFDEARFFLSSTEVMDNFRNRIFFPNRFAVLL